MSMKELILGGARSGKSRWAQERAQTTGLVIGPMGALTRRYCDAVGRLRQELAALCDRVTFLVAGLPHTLKGSPA